ncbi:carboxymuconolactone decarboxylase family protein [Falsirhodobacter deserti]|uniref:carboxymuconolactone decarboxylase family protein n=1 Tax=Falsirhodobacter deserti TaxID=1365611 RepID=UPI000FE37E6F|nr:carboxymuconolactone decarboxylase family protein [Falsirhodobacter deserti]
MNDEFGTFLKAWMEQGQSMARSFAPQGDLSLSREMMEMWFGNTFNREGLDARTRMLVTLGAMVARGVQGDVLVWTLRHARTAGATHREVAETILQMGMLAGLPAAQSALDLARQVFDEEEKPA